MGTTHLIDSDVRMIVHEELARNEGSHDVGADSNLSSALHSTVWKRIFERVFGGPPESNADPRWDNLLTTRGALHSASDFYNNH